MEGGREMGFPGSVGDGDESRRPLPGQRRRRPVRGSCTKQGEGERVGGERTP